MSDYLYVPKCADVYTEGRVIFNRDGVGDYKVGYIAGTAYSIKVGLYQRNSNLYFVFVAPSLISDINIQVVIPSSETVINVTAISTTFESGYYGEENYTVIPSVSAVTIFSNRNDVLEAMSYYAPPSGDSGVVITAMASPIDTPITSEGVIVTAVARLLDPNQQGGTSAPGGGQGTFDETSDVIPAPPLPIISAANSGLVTLFKPSLSDLHDLGEYLWTNLTDFIENLQKMFSNPMDYFVAFNILPVIPETGTPRNIKLGLWNTNITMPPVLSQWYELNCGVVSVKEYWGSALDYAPNTKISLFLPFIGSVTLNTDEVMGRNVGVIYRIDLLSGQCVAMVTVSGLVDQTASVLYQFTGECAVSVPMTGADWSRVYSAAIGAVGTAITGGIAAGAAGTAAAGATAALAGAQAADAAANVGMAYSLINDTSKGVKGVTAMREQMLQASQMALNAGNQAAAQPARVARGIRASRMANTVNNVVGNVMGAKASVNHAGTISGSAGMLGVKTPYLLIEYPNQSLAENYKHFVGYPSNMFARLGDLSGYTEVEQVIAAGLVNQTDAEMSELVEALKGGVYL